MTVETTISRAEKEIENGRLWRAKEILASSIATYGYSRELLLVLAEVLLKMGDDLEAGKYFLLTVDKPSDREMDAISIFLARYGGDYRILMARFPPAVRIGRRDEYPEYLRKYLTELGAPQTLGLSERRSASKLNPLSDLILGAGCFLLALLAIACMFVGAKTILVWFFGSL